MLGSALRWSEVHTAKKAVHGCLPRATLLSYSSGLPCVVYLLVSHLSPRTIRDREALCAQQCCLALHVAAKSARRRVY